MMSTSQGFSDRAISGVRKSALSASGTRIPIGIDGKQRILSKN